ncbi:hypothetical protein [Streptomyces sp. NRRL S-118]|uniref:hypothetical protein n=1 Tax=Streptomyces sp. NRRL S-118 TaxID=1463881 RepID=UPI000AA75C56|nr:hypothetical protein [Streptomyces sp. NRRL S-118]
MSLQRTMALAAAGSAACLFLAAPPSHAAPGDVTTVCASTLTPAGFVDVSWGTSLSCGSGSAPNIKQIKQLTGLAVGTTVNACASTYPPAGWVQTSTYYTSSCRYSVVPSFNPNAWTLKRVS